jgi:hypothetical protein
VLKAPGTKRLVLKYDNLHEKVSQIRLAPLHQGEGEGEHEGVGGGGGCGGGGGGDGRGGGDDLVLEHFASFVDPLFQDFALNAVVEVRPARCCSPPHPAHFEPWFLEFLRLQRIALAWMW